MRPLQAVGAGLLVVALTASLAEPGFDLFPDPIGWLLVLHGVRRLPDPLPLRGPALVVAAVAGLVSVVLWIPATAAPILAADESLQWTLNLGQIGFLVLLSLALSQAAREGDDDSARRWWRLALAGSVVTAILPPLAYGGGLAGLVTPSVVFATVVLLTCLVLCFVHSGRQWATAEPVRSD